MANYKGNRYPVWAIEVDGTVVAYDAMATRHVKSKATFARQIAISDDGTVWIVSYETDASGGGLKIYFSDGNSDWQEADGKGPGAFKIAGTSDGNCVIITNDYELYALNQKKEYTKLDTGVYEIDCGGGYFWALKPLKEGSIPVLHYSSAKGPLQWKVFDGNVSPTSLSVSLGGDCWALLDEVPYYFKKDGKTKNAVIPGATIDAIQISYKNYTNGILSATDVTDKGNLFLQYNSSPTIEPVYLPVKGMRADSMVTTYYVP
ncbi:MAG: hypothetical protein KTR22_01215 [Flavobacteriaceae bacterium]|nr:hypothetical protein [Flavobacteriaceae bacterium]